MWAAVLLRVLIFIIPAYFIYRGISACMRYHNGNVDAARCVRRGAGGKGCGGGAGE